MKTLPLLMVLVMLAGAIRPATRPVEAIAGWFDDLADADASRREEARINLMGLNRSQLPELRGVVEQSVPLLPSQSAVLRDIVVHVYLAGEPYESAPQIGFIGLKWSAEESERMGEQGGIIVSDRMPGFCGFRMFQPGDVIMGIVERPTLPLRNSRDLTAAVVQEKAGTTLHFEILRQGRSVHVPITLNARPARADGMLAIEEMLRVREEKALAYWQQAFAPLLKQVISQQDDRTDRIVGGRGSCRAELLARNPALQEPRLPLTLPCDCPAFQARLIGHTL